MAEQQQRAEKRMKVTLTTIAAGPLGVAKPGAVFDLPEKTAKAWIDSRFAIEHDKVRDAKAPVGFTKAPERHEQ